MLYIANGGTPHSWRDDMKTEWKDWYEAQAARYEALKAERDAEAIALAVRALEACAWNVTNHPDGEQQQFQQSAYLAKKALAALKGGGK